MSHSPLFCPDTVLPLSLHCAGTTKMGLYTQPGGRTDPAKRNPAIPPASSVSSKINFKFQFIAQLEKSCVAVRKRVVYHNERNK